MASQSDAVAGAAQPQPPVASEIQTTAAQQTTTEKPLEMTEQPMTPLTTSEEFKDAVQEQQEDAPASENPAAPALTPSEPVVAPSSQSEPETNTQSQPEALGPATEGPIVPPTPSAAAGPTLNIVLLLQNGNRHSYKIDERYLRNRKVEARNMATGAFDPKEISGYQLKELIWTDWRSEWEPRPASPSSIRLIHMGKLIEDKAALKDARFNMESSNVVHMTVKPAELEDNDETGKAGKSGVLRARDAEERGAGCRCVIL